MSGMDLAIKMQLLKSPIAAENRIPYNVLRISYNVKTVGISACKIGRMGKMRNKFKRRENRIKTLHIKLIALSLILVFTLPVFSQQAACAVDNSLANLEAKMEQSRYSGFQKRMISEAAAKLLSLDINTREVEKLLAISIENNFDAYNIKKIIEILIDAKNNNISEKSLMNKFKEGLAKKVDERLIVEVLTKEARNLKVAKNIFLEHPIQDSSYKEEIIVESLAEGLNNGVPRDSLSEVFSRSVREGKDLREVAEVSTELGNLSLRALELGFSEEEVDEVFQKAVLSRSGVDGICEDIQDMLVAAVVTKTNMASRNSSGGTDNNITTTGESTTTDGTSSSGDNLPSPSSGSISTPTSSDDKPYSNDKPDSGDTDTSPPEN
jgi:hypothetical protein